MSKFNQIQSFVFNAFKLLGFIALVFLVYITGCLLHGSLTDYSPSGVEDMVIHQQSSKGVIADSTLTFLTWNIGYSGLGKESDFFYNGGGFFLSGNKMVRPPEDLVQKNTRGIIATVLQKAKTTNFILLQEVDYHSKRSYYTNHQEILTSQLPKFAYTSAINFDVARVPTPIFEPWNVYGACRSGLTTLSAYTPSQAQRHQLPGEFSWPNRIFLLDRCLAINRYPTQWGKDLIVINLHNSAYDRSGNIKKQQMEYLKTICQKEYQKGNYVVVGGDWNQCPPGFKFDTFQPGAKQWSAQPNIANDFMPQDWQWIYDPEVPTIRSTSTPYDATKSFTSLIDFYLVSPNIEMKSITGIDHEFDFSDHQAVEMKVRLQ